MGETIRIANEKRGYTLADRGTFLASEGIELVVLVEKDPILLNPYGVIVVNPDKYPRVNHKGAQAFIEFLTSPRIQKMIGEFGQEKYGEPLFVPDALE
jgi:tungstate transport system substrate-binding protein